MIHSILLIGQSNAGGRGFVSEAPALDNENILVLRNGRWRQAYRPLNPDRVTSGVCFAESFAACYRDSHPDVQVGVIPCADGGSSLDMWQVGGLLFDHTCYLAELASRTSTIAAVLWHQGESDTSDEKYPLYEEKLTVILEALRKKLNLHVLEGLGVLGKMGPLQRVNPIALGGILVGESLRRFFQLLL